jgi:hypothetical protein
MTRLLRTAGQLAAIVLLFAAVSAFSAWPVYRQTPPGTAVLLLTFVHGSDRKAECRRLTPEEIAKLPANMRRTEVCPRRRMPLHVELDVDGRTVFAAELPPTGIAGDGASRVYRRFVLPAGEHELAVRMRDKASTRGFDHQRTGRVALAPDQMMVIDFRADSGEFVFR